MEPSNELKIALVKLTGDGEAAKKWWSSWNHHLNGRPDMLYRNNRALVENYIQWLIARKGL